MLGSSEPRRRVLGPADLRDTGGGAPEIGRGAREDLAADREPSSFSPFYEFLTEEQLEARYGDMGESELVGAMKGLEWTLHADSSALLAEQFDRGIFTTTVVLNGQEVVHPLATEDGGLQAVSVRTVPLEDGTVAVERAEVRFSDHPILATKDAEISWVRKKLLDKYGAVFPYLPK